MSGMLHASADLTISLSLCLHLAPSLPLSLSLYPILTTLMSSMTLSPLPLSLPVWYQPAYDCLERERERELSAIDLMPMSLLVSLPGTSSTLLHLPASYLGRGKSCSAYTQSLRILCNHDALSHLIPRSPGRVQG
jgi:hypothetical protein